MNVLITGASGQLGSEIRFLAKNYPKHNYFFENSKNLDITSKLQVEQYVSKNKIEAIINCAAYTAVDKAEEDITNAKKVNSEGVENLISLLGINRKMIHISTDYVFNGKSHTPYREIDKAEPLGVYGKTKRLGEEFILKSTTNSIVIRTSWLYSSFGNNFVKTMMRLGQDRNNLNVVADQIGSPTYAKDLAKICLELIDKDFKDYAKVYHYANEGVTSWYDFAKTIMEVARISCKVHPINTEDYPTVAQRPKKSVLDISKIKQDFGIKIPYWKDSLKACIKKLKE